MLAKMTTIFYMAERIVHDSECFWQIVPESVHNASFICEGSLCGVHDEVSNDNCLVCCPSSKAVIRGQGQNRPVGPVVENRSLRESISGLEQLHRGRSVQEIRAIRLVSSGVEDDLG